MTRFWKLFLCWMAHVHGEDPVPNVRHKWEDGFLRPVWRCLRCGELFAYRAEYGGDVGEIRIPMLYEPEHEEPFL